MQRLLLSSALLPYTTLFRSHRGHRCGAQPGRVGGHPDLHVAGAGVEVRQHGLAVELFDAHLTDLIAPERGGGLSPRSEEHTSELSHVAISYAVFCLKKKTQK